MKINIENTLTNDGFSELLNPFVSGVKEKDLIPMDYVDFMESYYEITGKLNMIMPEVHQRGLMFNITAPLGKNKPRDKLRAPWVTIYRGSKHWFIVRVKVDRPAIWSNHPVNLVISEDNEARLWSIIEKVTSPSWFNSK